MNNCVASTIGTILVLIRGCVQKPLYLEDKMDNRKLARIYHGIKNTGEWLHGFKRIPRIFMLLVYAVNGEGKVLRTY